MFDMLPDLAADTDAMSLTPRELAELLLPG